LNYLSSSVLLTSFSVRNTSLNESEELEDSKPPSASDLLKTPTFSRPRPSHDSKTKQTTIEPDETLISAFKFLLFLHLIHFINLIHSYLFYLLSLLPPQVIISLYLIYSLYPTHHLSHTILLSTSAIFDISQILFKIGKRFPSDRPKSS
jgi:hypothetical protein